MTDFSVEVENLSVSFADFQILDNINIQIPQGVFLTIVGPNGAGKTTFLKVLLGLITPTSGKVKLFDKRVREVSPSLIGYVPQAKTMDRSFPAVSIELVMTGINNRWPWRMGKTEKKSALDALEEVGATHLAQRPISRLSGGELQRICLARSIVRNPRIVMLDEPATGIDMVGEADLYKYLEQYQNDSKATIIMVTHDWHAVTNHADQVLLLNNKQIAFGTPDIALTENNLRQAFGHIGHKHSLKFLVKNNE
jgi:zinc transport system ATP-binding protein